MLHITKKCRKESVTSIELNVVAMKTGRQILLKVRSHLSLITMRWSQFLHVAARANWGCM